MPDDAVRSVPSDAPPDDTARALLRARRLAASALVVALAAVALAGYAVVRTPGAATGLRIEVDGQTRVLVDEHGLVIRGAQGKALLVAGESEILHGGQIMLNAGDGAAMISLSSSASMSNLVELRDGDSRIQLASSQKDHGGHAGIAMETTAPEGSSYQTAGFAIDHGGGAALAMSRISKTSVATTTLSIPPEAMAGPTLAMRNDTGAPAQDRPHVAPPSPAPSMLLSYGDQILWQLPKP